MSIEAGVVIDDWGHPLHWHLPAGRDNGALPDSSDLWKILWANRDIIMGFAHSHPGSGLPEPSHTDVTTFAAVEQGLGKRLHWYICSSDRLVLVQWAGPGVHDYGVHECVVYQEIPWLMSLRERSDYHAKP
jgi:hypothetical protein